MAANSGRAGLKGSALLRKARRMRGQPIEAKAQACGYSNVEDFVRALLEAQGLACIPPPPSTITVGPQGEIVLYVAWLSPLRLHPGDKLLLKCTRTAVRLLPL